MEFLTSEPAVIEHNTLIIADLHIGIEHEFRRSGISVPSQTGKMAERIEMLLKKTGAERLVIIGDVKHNVPGTSWQEEREVPRFFERMRRMARVDVVPGNHDGNLKKLVHGVRIRPTSGFLLKNIYLNHGHAWPKPAFLKADYILVGHSHPGIEFRCSLGYRWLEPVWFRAGLNRPRLARKYGNVKKAPELILLPAFNHLVGSVALNRSLEEGLLGPIMKCADVGKGRIYLMDGTLLGELGKLRN